MKTLTRVAVYALALSVAPFSLSYAQEPMDLTSDTYSDEMVESDQTVEDEIDLEALQEEMKNEDPDRPPTLEEAKAALETLPGSKHAVKGNVPVSKENKVYDIYGRQLAYREGAKEYTDSLNKRREEFAKPRTERIEAYQKTRDIIYAAETAEYQKKLNEEKDEMMVSEEKRAPKLPTGEAYEASVEFAPVAEEVGLKEQRIPTDPSERRKVVTAGNAPEFDPSRLNRAAPVAAPDASPPPMPVAVKAAPKKEAEKIEVAPVPVEEEAEVVVPMPEEVEEPIEAVEVEPVVEPETAEGEDVDNPFAEDEVENPFAEKEERLFND